MRHDCSRANGKAVVMVRRLALCATIIAVALFGLAGSAFGFGLREFAFTATESPGRVIEETEPAKLGPADTAAGSHPFALTTSFKFDTTENSLGRTVPAGDVKDIEAALPAGLVGNANAMPQCSTKDFHTPNPELAILFPSAEIHSEFSDASCPDNTQVGWVTIEVEPGSPPAVPLTLGIYNLVPPPGVPAEFGFNPIGLAVTLAPHVRTGGDYGLTVGSRNTTQVLRIFGTKLTFWGVPADPRHDIMRGRCLGLAGESLCSTQARAEEAAAGLPQFAPVHPGLPPVGFLSLPTSCSGAPLPVTLTADSWQEPGVWKSASATLPTLSGCERPVFSSANPSIATLPDTFAADTPAGLTAEVKMNQEGLTAPEGIAPADLRNTKVTLPEGLVINPGQAAGLQACQASEDALGTEEAPSCPLASKVGTDEIETPLLKDRLEGNVYVLQSNPPHLQLLVVASGDGVNLKLVGDVHLDETTGRVVTTFEGTPPLPFTDFKLAFSGGARAALATPTQCGSYRTLTDFTPWSSPFEQDALESSAFPIETGPGGAPCASPLPFAPSMTAGSTNDQAGASTNFSLLLERPDGQQRISTLRFKTPAGLLGMISKVPLCGEPQASLGTCPAVSQIGHTVVEAGPGPYPLVVPQPGQPPAPIYLTGGYHGAPYGLSIAVPVIAGPFNLGTVVVRSSINVDPRTAQLTITTDPLPAILDGIPTDLRTINAVIDRPGFMFNPTNCNETAFTGTANSTLGTAAPLSYRFQVGSCRSLAFHPTLSVSSAARTSKANGASLSFKIAYPPGAMGTESWFNEAKFDLPKQLPARLTTLQQACLAATFEANPASCPAHSLIGNATVHTPVLPVPLTGPVYFVSYGGAKFPEAVLVLQGYGITVDLHGETFINGKTGVTSATFRNTPDVPFESIEVNIPTGPYSEFGANLPAKAKGSFCGQKLVMPTRFKAQNGLEIHQNTKITVTGCRKPRTAHNTRKARKARKVTHRTRRSK
jgi:hypothetical protein